MVAMVDTAQGRLDGKDTFIGDEEIRRGTIAQSGVRLGGPGLGRRGVLDTSRP